MTRDARLTADAVTHYLGEVEPTVVAEILATGATLPDLVEAEEWLCSDDYIGGKLKRQMSPVVGRVCDILESQLPDPADNDR